MPGRCQLASDSAAPRREAVCCAARHRVTRQQVGADRLREVPRGALAGDAQRGEVGQPGQLPATCGKPVRRGRGQHDQVGRGQASDADEVVHRGVRAEEPDAPPPLVQHDPEREERQVVQLARWAGQPRHRSVPAAPAPAEDGQPAPHHLGGEVLLGDGKRTPGPVLADAMHHGDEDVAEGVLDGHGREAAVEHPLGALLVEVAEGAHEVAAQFGGAVVPDGRREVGEGRHGCSIRASPQVTGA